ncbi:sigma 54-interacting transcriptional regulator [Proteiniclasticum sp. C24MP]|uniref:sigma 54-interacting transcriptional regulator n=1 Tax=Proteiniclasticum sp. C24MP TaxID=3374101 RepID=UPI003754AE07
MKDIVVLAPIQDVYDKTAEIISEQGYSNVDVVLGTMSKGLEIAKQLEKEGVKIIVARGGTYKLVKSQLKIPVVEIKVSAYDIVNSFDQIKDPNEVIGLVGYSNVVFGFNVLKKIIPNEVQMILLNSESEIPDIIEEYKGKGIRTFVGDSNAAKVVQGLNCRGIMISSQKESIQVAIQEARRILSAIKHEKHMTEHLRAVMNFVGDGIISIDHKDRITHFNQTAENILKIPAAESIGRKIHEVFTNPRIHEMLQSKKKYVGEMVSEGRLKLSFNQIPLLESEGVNGTVITFQEIQEIQRMEFNIRKSIAKKGFVAKYDFGKIIHKSAEMKDSIETAREYALYDAPVHIFGESGTGKELFAQSIHNASKRRDGAFLAVNCAALPANLIESEFFGYEEGAFTGAKKSGKPGIFELAHNGTLFLDEISEIPMELQGRLLRVLQEKEVRRVGGNKVIPVDVRIITASNRKLQDMVEKDLFRKDLYYRINVLALRIPTLKERTEDIVLLAEHFIDKFSRLYGKKKLEVTEPLKQALLTREFEGNIRELENLMERSVIVSSFDQLLQEREAASPQAEKLKRMEPGEEIKEIPENSTLKNLEDWYIQKVFHENEQNVQKTCDILGISRSTLWRKLQK